MRNTKIISMLMTIMLALTGILTITGTSPIVSGANTNHLYGNVTVNLTGFIGIVTPSVDFDEESEINQTVTFYVNVTEFPLEPKNNTYKIENGVNELYINMKINNQSMRETFLLPRTLIYLSMLTRNPKDLPITFRFDYLKRLIPSKHFGVLHVANSLMGKEIADNITIPIKAYSISNETYNQGLGKENMTLHLIVAGFLPGDANGITDKLPIVSHVKINLKIEYKPMVIE